MNWVARSSEPSREHVYRLANSMLCGDITGSEAHELECLVASDPTVRRWYIEFICDATNIRAYSASMERVADPGVRPSFPSNARYLPIDSEPESTGNDALVHTPFPADLLENPFSNTAGSFSSWPLAYLIATAIFAVGALIGTFTHVSRPVEVAHSTSADSMNRVAATSDAASVGTMTGISDCKWAGTDRVAREVTLGSTYKLVSGLAEITYNTGAKVILQGPVTFEVDSGNGGYLSSGKLTAQVEKNKVVSGQWSVVSENKSTSAPSPLASRPSSLFIIKTPTAVITDLGTEFGVEVDRDRHTLTHVFRGSVKVQRVDDRGDLRGDERVLRENETIKVDRHAEKSDLVVLGSFTPSEFVRRLPDAVARDVKTLDLIDVVAGGDGFSGKRGRGIDPSTGRIVEQLWQPSEDARPLPSDGQYQRVPEIPFVDGVFIPPSGGAPVQTDSGNHTYADFGNSDGLTWQCIWAGGAMLNPHYSSKVGEIDYAAAPHGVLLLHANNAITFDLDAIRKAHPDDRIVRFRTMTANTEHFSQEGHVFFADLWVLVDGEVRFRRRQINGYSGGVPASVLLKENDRFLTLAGTDGGNGIGGDFIVFGDPCIEMTPASDRRGPGHEVNDSLQQDSTHEANP